MRKGGESKSRRSFSLLLLYSRISGSKRKQDTRLAKKFFPFLVLMVKRERSHQVLPALFPDEVAADEREPAVVRLHVDLHAVVLEGLVLWVPHQNCFESLVSAGTSSNCTRPKDVFSKQNYHKLDKWPNVVTQYGLRVSEAEHEGESVPRLGKSRRQISAGPGRATVGQQG